MSANNRPFDVVLFGATGYTGKLIAGCLQGRGLSYALAGRNPEKLRALSASLAEKPPILMAESGDAKSLLDMAKVTRVLVSAAGPFAQQGEAVVRACLKGGSHYLDTTAELPFILHVTRTFHEQALKKHLAVGPAFGFDVAPGHLAGCMALAALPQAQGAQVNLYYQFHRAVYSRGSAKSMFAAATEEGVVFEGGRFEAAHALDEKQDVRLPGEKVAQQALLMPLGEVVTLAHSLPVAEVKTWVVMEGVAAPVTKMLWPLFARFMHSAAGPKLLKGLDLMPEGPDPWLRQAMGYVIHAHAVNEVGQSAWAVAEGSDAYGLTGELLAVYAQRLAQGEVAASGVITPHQLGDAAWLQSVLKKHPVVFRLV